MNTFVIYDNSGYIIFYGQGSFREPIGIPFMRIDIPEKKRLVSIDVSVIPNVPVYEDIPKTEEEKVKERLSATEDALMFLMDMNMM